MPEMPEVEQVRKTLAPHIEGKKITSLEVYLDRLIKHPTATEFVEGLVGKTVHRVGRKGKYLVLQTDANQKLIVHLRMTGALIAQSSELEPPAYANIAPLEHSTWLPMTMPISRATKPWDPSP